VIGRVGALTSVAFPVAGGQPLTVGAFRFCQFPASDHAKVSLPDSVMIGALPGGAAGAGERVTVNGVARLRHPSPAPHPSLTPIIGPDMETYRGQATRVERCSAGG
jgi:hypothetical protein